ncbi:MAG: hypothetical protein R3B13_05960 [Polyangiaceae bacterium]
MNRSATGVVAFVALSALMACKMLDRSSSGTSTTSTPTTTPELPASNEVAFKRLVPKVGTKGTMNRKTTMKFTFQNKVFRQTTVMDTSWEVKASDEFRITKASLNVKELYTTNQEGSGTEKRSVSPLAGSTYLVTREGEGKLAAEDSGGSKVSSSVLKLIKDEFAGIFEKSHDADFLPDTRPVKLEEKLTPASDTMLKVLGIKDDGNTLIDGTEFFLKSHESSVATFDSTMTMTQKIPGGLRVRAKLKGKFEMRPEGAWIVGVDLKGPLEILDSKGDAKGTGDLSLEGKQTFD